MVCIEGGSYINGEAPQATRDVATYWLDRTEVTVAAYAACVTAGGTGCTTPSTDTYCNWGVAGRDDHPINCVDWFQADAYCAWAGKRLPDEWEWEWAARGRDAARSYPWGEESATCARAVMDDAGVSGCGADSTSPVGSKSAGASRDGALDLAGNVYEWTASWYDGTQQYRVLRGGSWFSPHAGDLRADYRVGDDPSLRGNGHGFRCARTP